MTSRFRERALGATVLVAVLEAGYVLTVAFSLDNPARLTQAHSAAAWVGMLIGVGGTVAAARTFSPGDHLRRVWGLIAFNLGLIGLGIAMRTAWGQLAPGQPYLASPFWPWHMGFIIVANVASSYALVLMALTFQRTGLVAPASWAFRLLGLLALGFALALAAPALKMELARFAKGGTSAVSAVANSASTMGDMFTVVLIVPILRAAYLLRGGRVAWAWWAMGISGVVWLAYDSTGWLAALLPGDVNRTQQLFACLRGLGLALSGLAGYLQHAALGPVDVETPAVAEPAGEA